MASPLVQPLDRAEIPAAARLHVRAFGGDPMREAMFPGAGESAEWLQYLTEVLSVAWDDPSQHFFKVVTPEPKATATATADENTANAIMGVAQWRTCTAEASSRVAHLPPTPQGMNMDLLLSHRNLRSKNREEIVGDRPHYYLSWLATDPHYQRRGVGRALLRQGLDHAAEQNLEVYLEGGPQGLPLYRQMGFVQLSTITTPELDPGQDGLQNKLFCMIWKPASAPGEKGD